MLPPPSINPADSALTFHGSTLLVMGGADSGLHAGVTLLLTDRLDTELLNFPSTDVTETSSSGRIS